MDEAFLVARQSRRFKAEDRALARREALEAKAGNLVGVLVREGSIIYYIMRPGATRMIYHENKAKAPLIDFLIRNKYV